jgi:hypothetical protein
MMVQPPQVEPLASTFYRVPEGPNAPTDQVHTRFEETRFDEAVYFGGRMYLIDYTIISTPLTILKLWVTVSKVKNFKTDIRTGI